MWNFVSCSLLHSLPLARGVHGDSPKLSTRQTQLVSLAAIRRTHDILTFTFVEAPASQ
jgi:hypothetical protein